jgi:GGDEF domain-containing protein
MDHRCNPARIVTVSAGAATTGAVNTTTARMLIESADAALYAAKAAGRDCVRGAARAAG